MKLKLLFITSVFCVFNAMNAQSGDPSVFGDNVWNVYAYNSTDSTFPVSNYAGFYTESNLSFDTQARWNQNNSPSDASGYTGNAVGNDNHSYAAKRTGFTPGYYAIDIPSHDDGAYLFVNGVQVWNHISCCDSHSGVWKGTLDGDSTLEFRVMDTGGGGSHGSIKVAMVTINAVVAPFSSSSCETTVTITATGGMSPYTGTGVFTVSPGTHNYTVSDDSGATSSTSVEVKDDSKPTVITQNIIVNLDANGQATVTPAMINYNSTDNCGITGMSLDKTTFTCSDIGDVSAQPVAFTNVGAASQNIHSWGGGYNPNTNEFWYPAWSGSTIYKYDASHNATGSFNAPVSQIMQLWMDKSSSDYYTANWSYNTIKRISGSTVVWSYNLGTTASSVTTSDLYVFATSPSTNTIVVLDKTTGAFVKNINLPGTINTYGGLVYANGIIYVSGVANGGFSTVPYAWNAIHAFDAGTGAYISSVATAQNCFNTAFDGETIWISDSSSGSITINGYKISNGNVKLTVTDAAGNTATKTAKVIVKDITAPVITTDGDKNVTTDLNVCGASVVVSASATDNCTVDAPTGVRSDDLALDAVYPVGTTTITWNTSDINGNAAVDVVQTVIVTDNQLPVITFNGDKNVDVDADVCGASVLVSASATDNCTLGALTGVRSDALALDALYPIGTTTITWNVLDVNNNAGVEVIQTVIVTDNQLPVITFNGDKNVDVDADVCGASVLVSASATDNCTLGALTGVRSDALALDALYPIGTTTITWNVLDVNNNAGVEVIQTVIVTDNQLPVITFNGDKNVDVDADVCGASVLVSASATDNCTLGALTGVRSDALALDALYPIGTTIITWNVLDVNNNAAAEVIQTVIVTDNQLPVITANGDKNVTTDLNVCGATVVVSASATDNCTLGALTGVRSDALALNALYPKGTTTITWNVSDANGNAAAAVIQKVTVVDAQKPTITTLSAINVNADAGVCTYASSQLTAPTAADNCSVRSVVASPASLVSGANTVTWTVTDGSGLTATSTQTVTVVDNEAPIVLTKNIPVQLDASGNASITAAQINNGSTDNCGIASISLSKLTFSCANVGANTVILTVRDVNGNVATASAVVMVVNTFGDNDSDGIKDNCDDDDDNDGVLDGNDNCSLIANANQADNDQDILGDVCDDDDDNDGILDTVDNCPMTYNPNQEDRDHDGLGDLCDLIEVNVAEAMTPNGDGVNDTWVIYNIENHPNSMVRVFNRWGTEVFSARNYQNDWDGHSKNNSQLLPEGSSYYYQIDFEGDGTIDKEGWIYINR
ncbi:gliding motility-associated C-terminal domain-containing protein [Flavobacterium rhamnosiphilum]|uniref:Gliding motility-associated C-terminal domain-containing protein n=1 Tax=Flavobacterium rhamnosiphilum TaxID=2541724 RepID=A0A4R5F4J1_9FLAO|nr:gliding motility-associated C-terminal domain-containing protein [Flavobacterium rhamnosiphilum]TDE42476.1 gliding motility-associated C-terminal domain-containing protein [Flavobacterium rhamnosiphilum]